SLVLALGLAAVLCPAVMAQTQDNPLVLAPATAPEIPPTPPETQQILDAVLAAYHHAPILVDSVRLNTQVGDIKDRTNWTLQFGKGNDTSFEFVGGRLATVNDRLYFSTKSVLDKILQQQLENNPAIAAKDVLSPDFVPFHYALRYGSDFQDVLHSMTFGRMKSVHVVGHVVEDHGASGKAIVIKFEGDDHSAGSFQVAADTHLVQKIEFSMNAPQTMPSFGKTTIELLCQPQILDSLDTPIAVNLNNRIIVHTMDDLKPSLIREGDEAPDFTLKTVDGQTVMLSSLRGSVVVLDFWATWCKPCQTSLPMLKSFSTWAESSGQPVKVYAVNVWERIQDPETRVRTVTEFWKQSGNTVPMLIDVDDSVPPQYGFDRVPSTIVISPFGKISALYIGTLRDDYIEALKADCNRAFE
ncbi:MAG TPA: redoxin family protein, partial [Phycisphaerales bacterium]|nr:redoxin family protein [Phycisphaerales bacterium]